MCGITASVALDAKHIPKRNSAGLSAVKHDSMTNGGVEKSNHHGQIVSQATLTEQLYASLDKILHRGPDDRKVWTSPDGHVGLGHCRLAINDLTPSGCQPFHSSCNTVHAVVNGELYDHERIRAELIKNSNYQFGGGSDCEIVVALYQEYGLTFLNHLRGEFALCLYDESRRLFVAARDRYGIKPLFWTEIEGRLVISAEAKAFLPLGWKPEWDVRAIVDAGWGHDTRTVFKGVQKVRPGHYLTCTAGGHMESRQYWDIEYPDKHHIESRTEHSLVEGVREQLLEAVRLRLRADVPVGIYLSGGIDSSVIAGMATHLVKEQRARMGSQDANDRICCFSIAFEEGEYDESDISHRTAEWLGVKYSKRLVDEKELAAG